MTMNSSTESKSDCQSTKSKQWEALDDCFSQDDDVRPIPARRDDDEVEEPPGRPRLPPPKRPRLPAKLLARSTEKPKADDPSWQEARALIKRAKNPDGTKREPHTVQGGDPIRDLLTHRPSLIKMMLQSKVKDTDRAFSGKPITLRDQNGELLCRARLTKNKLTGVHDWLLIQPEGGWPMICSLGTVYAVQVLGITRWPHAFRNPVEVRMWTARLAIESGVVPAEQRTPLPLFTDQDFVRAVTRKCGGFGLNHAIALADGLSTMIDVERLYLPKMHKSHPGYAPLAESYRVKWLPRYAREWVTPGASNFIWWLMRQYGYIEIKEGEYDEAKHLHKAGLYRLNPKFQQKVYDNKIANRIAMATLAEG
jgi:hypothetical protein